jgi:hypothetical protein
MEIQTRERTAGVSFHVLQRIGLIKRMQSSGAGHRRVLAGRSFVHGCTAWLRVLATVWRCALSAPRLIARAVLGH